MTWPEPEDDSAVSAGWFPEYDTCDCEEDDWQCDDPSCWCNGSFGEDASYL